MSPRLRAETAGAVPAAASCLGDAHIMTAVSKWVAAGSSAAVFAGGLFLGAPAAVAAPGDAVCLQAFIQFEAALSAAGITEATLPARGLLPGRG